MPFDRIAIDRQRAGREMARAGLAALVLFQPEHIAAVIGIGPGPAGLFRRAGAASVIVPADPDVPLGVVMPDLMAGAVRASGLQADVAYHRIWVDHDTANAHDADTALSDVLGRARQPPRPATFDPVASFHLLADQLAARGLEGVRLGLDLGFVPAADFELLRAVMPTAALADGTDTLRRLRMVKSAAEIVRLRAALDLSEAGLERALAAIRLHVTRDELSAAYRAGVEGAARARSQATTGAWDYISIGPDPWGAGRPAEPGDVIKFDVGVVIDGYSSDMARTVVFGAPSRAARELHATLLAGLEVGLSRLRPGARVADVHAAVLNAVQSRCVPGYARGHFGHGLGNDPFSEQWPFIAADCSVVLEPGMVLALEAPHYVDGLGGFIIEEQVLVTDTGIEIMSRWPRGLTVYG